MAGSPADTNKFKVGMQAFYGGMSVDFKYGIQASFLSSQALDFRKYPSQMSTLPAARQLTSSLSDLVLGIEQATSGDRYMAGDLGHFYKMDTSNVITDLGTLNEASGAGIVYNLNTDTVYLSGQTAVSLYGRLSSSPTLIKDNFAQSVSVDPGCTLLFNATDGLYDGVARSTGAATYTVPTSIAETATAKCNFQPDIEPGYSVKVWVTAKGTGNWTLTLHDPLNNALASVTKTNASLTNGAYNEFVFPAQVRMNIKPSAITYHLHLTSTVADGTAQVVTASDLSTLNFQFYAYRLIQTQNKLHPMMNFTRYLCIGNGNYLSTYDYTLDSAPPNTAWIRNRLVFPSGYEVCGMANNGQYLVIALEKRSSSVSKNFQSGYLALWDGVAGSPNDYIPVPMGSPYGIYSYNNITYFYVNGSLYAWAGGKTIIKVRTIAYTDTSFTNASDQTMAYPNMMATRNNILMLGYPSQTTNTSINAGVYSWGTIQMEYPNSWGYSYIPSHGITQWTSANLLRMGCVQSYGDTMYLSWQYKSGGTTFSGLDIIDNFSAPAPAFKWESLIFDGGSVFKEKQLLRYKLTFNPLPTGVTITPKYQINRGGWIFFRDAAGNPITATAGATQIVLDVPEGRFLEAQWGFDGVCSGATVPPEIKGVVMEIDPLGNEVDVI